MLSVTERTIYRQIEILKAENKIPPFIQYLNTINSIEEANGYTTFPSSSITYIFINFPRKLSATIR